MSPRFQLHVIFDALLKAKFINEQQHKDAIQWVDSVPGYLKATPEDYEKWKNETTTKA